MYIYNGREDAADEIVGVLDCQGIACGHTRRLFGGLVLDGVWMKIFFWSSGEKRWPDFCRHFAEE